MPSLACWLVFVGGCATKTVYLAGDEKVYHVQAGEPAPISGWLMSDAALVELYDAVDRQVTSERAPSTPGEAPNTPTTAGPARNEPDAAQ